MNVNDRWGNLTGFRGKIGYKRVLTFSKAKSSSSSVSEWVMHELHYTHTDLPEHKVIISSSLIWVVLFESCW